MNCRCGILVEDCGQCVDTTQATFDSETCAALRKRVAELEATLRAFAGQANIEPWLRENK